MLNDNPTIELIRLRESGIKYLTETAEANGTEPISFAINLLITFCDSMEGTEISYIGNNQFSIKFRGYIYNDNYLLKCIEPILGDTVIYYDKDTTEFITCLHDDLMKLSEDGFNIIVDTLRLVSSTSVINIGNKKY